MKAVIVVEWDLEEEDTTPEAWHMLIQSLMSQMPEDRTRPTSCGLAIMECADNIMAAFHGEPT